MSKISVLLVDPHWMSGEFEAPSLALGYLTAALRRHGIWVKIIDFVSNDAASVASLREFEKFEDRFISQICKEVSKGYELVGITCNYGAYPRVLKIADACKRTRPDVTIAVGGPFFSALEFFPQASGLPFVDSQSIDIVVRGEGEQTIVELAEVVSGRTSLESVKGISFRDREGVAKTPNRPLVEDLNLIERPNWSVFDLDKYADFLYVIAGRGCKYNCSFCDEKTIWGRHYRYRSTEDFVEEIHHSVHSLGIRGFSIEDATFTAYPHVEDFCREIISRKLDIRWIALGRADEAAKKPHLLALMREAGCISVQFGIESGNPQILRRMRKGVTLDQVQTAVSLAKATGMIVQGSFIVGFPGETRETALETIKFASDLDLDIYRWHTFQPGIGMLTVPERWSLPKIDWSTWHQVNLSVPETVLHEVPMSPLVLMEAHSSVRASGRWDQSENFDHSYRFSSLPVEEMLDLLNRALAETGGSVDENEVYGLLTQDSTDRES